jgi:hypothetical protein
MKMAHLILQPGMPREAFHRALSSSLAAYEFMRLKIIPMEDQGLFQRKVGRLSYVPSLPSAGDAERGIIQRLQKLATEKGWDGRERAIRMVQAFKAVLPQDPRHAG